METSAVPDRKQRNSPVGPFKSCQRTFACSLGLVSVSACGIFVPPAGDGGGTDGSSDFSYNIQELTRYDIHDCLSSNVNEITHLFEDEITPKFAGNRFHDGSINCAIGDGSECPFPSFVAESTQAFGNVDGQDGIHADASSVFVFAGHGGVNPIDGPALSYTLIDPGNPNPQGCTAFFNYHVRLGRLGGARARVGIWAASCVGAGDWWSVAPAPFESWNKSFGLSSTWQHLAFMDSPDLADNELQQFAFRVKNPVGAFGVQSNISIWLDETQYNLDTGSWNIPVVVTGAAPGETPFQLVKRHEDASFFNLANLPATGTTLADFVVDDDAFLGNEFHDPEPSDCEFY